MKPHAPTQRSLTQLRARSHGLNVEVLNKLGPETAAAPSAAVVSAPADAAPGKSILGSGFTGQVGSDVRVEDALVQVGIIAVVPGSHDNAPFSSDTFRNT